MRRKKSGIRGSLHGETGAGEPLDPPGTLEASGATDVPFIGSATVWLAWATGLAILAGVTFATLRFSAGREFLHQIARAQPWWLALAVLLQACTYLAQGEVWRLEARKATLALPFSVVYKLSLIKLFVNQALPSGGVSGSIIVAKVLEQHGIPRPISVASVLIDGTAYYIAFATALASALIITVAEGDVTVPLIISGLLLVAVAIGVAAGSILFVRTTLAAKGVFLRVPALRRALARLSDADPMLARNNQLLFKCSLLQLAIILLDTCTIWALIRSLDELVSPASVFTSFIASTLLRTLSIVPGGLGVFEAASVVTLQHAGVSLPVALAATLLFRGLSFWLPMVPGLWFAQQARAESARLPVVEANQISPHEPS
jgi:Mg2+-importing ATPase